MDDLFRNAHQDQIKWLEKTFNLSIKDTFKEWNGIILFFEIRNIIIHNDGVINRIFLANTAKSKFANKPQLGKKIMVDIESLDKMIDRVIEFVTYTSLCLVAKLYNKSDAYDKYVDSVIQVIYDLLVNKKYKAAVNLVNYCMSNNIKNSNGSRLTILINKCIALKHLNDDTYIDLLNEEDWSNSNNLFLLAKYALMEDLKNVSKYMILLGDDEQNLHSYIEWPLFDWVRDSVEFHQAFKQVSPVIFSSINCNSLVENVLLLSSTNDFNWSYVAHASKTCIADSMVFLCVIGRFWKRLFSSSGFWQDSIKTTESFSLT